MKRRELLKLVGAIPFVGLVDPEPKVMELTFKSDIKPNASVELYYSDSLDGLLKHVYLPALLDATYRDWRISDKLCGS